jgi:hypothetical protein
LKEKERKRKENNGFLAEMRSPELKKIIFHALVCAKHSKAVAEGAGDQ